MIAAVVPIVLIAVVSARLTAPRSGQGCDPGTVEAPSPVLEQPIALAPPERELAIDFGPGRRTRYASVDVTAAAPIPDEWHAFRVNAGTLSFEGRRELRGDGVTVTARRVSRQDIEVTLCIDPSEQEVRAGVYQGTVRFDDPRLQDLEVSVTVYAQQTTAWVWAAISIFGGLITAFIAYVLHGKDDSDRRLGRFGKLLPILLFVAAGFAAAFTQTARAYTSDRSWGADSFDGMLLAGQAIALSYGATVAATDIAKAASRAGRGSPGDEPDQAAAAP